MLDDIDTVRRLEFAEDRSKRPSDVIPVAQIVNRRNQANIAILSSSKQTKFKPCTLKNHKKRDYSYTLHEQRERGAVYITDDEDFKYVYEPSDCDLADSKKWDELPWFYQDLYISRVHNLAKMLGVEDVRG